jgi:hypothetical protein
LEPELQKRFDEGRLLIITPFEKKVKRVTKDTAAIRNKMMIEIADEIVIGYSTKNGALYKLIQQRTENKKLIYLQP